MRRVPGTSIIVVGQVDAGGARRARAFDSDYFISATPSEGSVLSTYVELSPCSSFTADMPFIDFVQQLAALRRAFEQEQLELDAAEVTSA